jgi:hypothetical protein
MTTPKKRRIKHKHAVVVTTIPATVVMSTNNNNNHKVINSNIFLGDIYKILGLSSLSSSNDEISRKLWQSSGLGLKPGSR